MYKYRDRLVEGGVPEAMVPHLLHAAEQWGIDTPLRLAHWLAQLGAESSFRPVEENLNYRSPERLCQVWSTRFRSVAEALPYTGQPKALANRVYSDRMGNGDEASGDGWKYRGRGLIQLTGRSNYHKFSVASGIPVEDDPDLLLQPDVSAATAGWYWKANGINGKADRDDLEAVTRAVNGGLHGLVLRRHWLERLKPLLLAPLGEEKLLIILGRDNEELFRFALEADDQIVTRAAPTRFYLRVENPRP